MFIAPASYHALPRTGQLYKWNDQHITQKGSIQLDPQLANIFPGKKADECLRAFSMPGTAVSWLLGNIFVNVLH
jgi:hypothetical protein